jgi:hypothetical protein
MSCLEPSSYLSISRILEYAGISSVEVSAVLVALRELYYEDVTLSTKSAV